MTLPMELLKDKSTGVICCEMSSALKNHYALINPVLTEVRDLIKNKFNQIHSETWQDGTFIYVPRGIVVEAPLHIKASSLGGNDHSCPLTVIILEPHSQLTLIDDMSSESHEEKQSSQGFRYAHVGEDASLNYVQIQRWAENVNHSEVQFSKLDQSARLTSVNVGLGGFHTQSNLLTCLDGKGAEAKLLGVFLGHGKQHFDIHTTQDHNVGETQSDLLYKSALIDEAQSNYEGIIQIPKEAQKSQAFQANRNLLLSPDAKARTIPKLEIVADDVRCTHAATVGTIDETETFYLQSRGIGFEDARKMIVQGFFEQVLSRIPSETVRSELSLVIEKKLNGEG